jgi:phage-related protein
VAGVGAPLATAFVRIKPDTKGFGRELKTQVSREGQPASDELRKMLSKATSKVDVRQLDTLAQKIRDIRTLSSATIRPIQDFANKVAKLAVVAGAASTALLAGTGLTGGILAVVAALSKAAGAAPVATAAITSLIGVLGTIKLATLGVADGFGEVVKASSKVAAGGKLSKAELAKLDESLKGLAPSARSLVSTFASLYPQLRRVQQTIQQRFFIGFGADLRALSQRYLPDLSRAAQGLAVVLNQTLRGAVKGLLNSTTQWNLAFLLGEARKQLTLFAPLLASLPRLFIDLATASAPAFTRIATDLSRVFAGVIDHIRGAVSDPGFTAGVNASITLIKQLGSVAHNVFASIRSIAAGASKAIGGDLIGSFAKATKAFSDFLGSDRGQDVLKGIFAAALPVLQQVGVVLRAIAPQLAGLAPVVAGLAKAFLTALQPVIPVAASLAKTLGGALTAVLPSISKVAVALGGALDKALRTLAPVIPILADAVASLLSPFGVFQAFLEAVTPVLPALARGLAGVAGILAGGLVALFKTLAPVLPQLVAAAVSLATVIANGLVGAFAQLAPVLPVLVNAFVHLAGVLAGGLAQALNDVAPLLPALAGMLVQLLGAFAPLIPVLLQLLPPMVNLAVAVLPSLVAALVKLAPVIIDSVRLFVAFQTVILAIAAPILHVLAVVISAVAGFVTGVERFFKSLPGKVLNALGGWRGAMVALVSSVFGGVIGIVVGRIADTVAQFRALPGRALGALAGWAGALARVAGAALSQMRTAITAGIGLAINYFANIPGRVVGAVGDLSRVLYNAGVQVIRGLIDGIQATLGSLRAVGGQVASILGGFLPGSPVKYGALRVLNDGYAGKQIVRMIAGGITSERGTVADSLSAVLAGATPQLSTAGAGFGLTGVPTGAASGGHADAIREALSGMAIRFDGDGLARLVTGRQAYAAAAGGRR